MHWSLSRLALPVGRAVGVFDRLFDRSQCAFAGALVLHTTIVCGLLLAVIWTQPN